MTARMTAARREELDIVPQPYDFAWPMLRSLHTLGGKTVARADLEQMAFRYMGLSAEQMAVLKPDGSQTEVSNRAAWALTYLSWANLVRSDGNARWAFMPAAIKLFRDHPLMDDVQRAAFVRGVTYGAKRAHEGVEQGRIRAA